MKTRFRRALDSYLAFFKIAGQAAGAALATVSAVYLILAPAFWSLDPSAWSKEGISVLRGLPSALVALFAVVYLATPKEGGGGRYSGPHNKHTPDRRPPTAIHGGGMNAGRDLKYLGDARFSLGAAVFGVEKAVLIGDPGIFVKTTAPNGSTATLAFAAPREALEAFAYMKGRLPRLLEKLTVPELRAYRGYLIKRRNEINVFAPGGKGELRFQEAALAEVDALVKELAP